jgi:hypothetical protein
MVHNKFFKLRMVELYAIAPMQMQMQMGMGMGMANGNSFLTRHSVCQHTNQLQHRRRGESASLAEQASLILVRLPSFPTPP